MDQLAALSQSCILRKLRSFFPSSGFLFHLKVIGDGITRPQQWVGEATGPVEPQEASRRKWLLDASWRKPGRRLEVG